MNYKRLETFVWVATLGSFRKVAERLHTTQPAISNRIASLEDEWGCRLFEREQGQGGIHLTTKGKELLPYAEKILYMSDQLKQRADADHLHSGLLRLGVSETIVHSWLPSFMAALREEMPRLDIELTVDVTSNLSAALLEHSIDLAFLMGPIIEPQIVNIDLCSYPLHWVASPALDLPVRRLKLNELTHWPIITYAKNTKPFAQINHRFRELGDIPVRFFSSSSLAASMRMTLDGVGISALPDAVIAAELERGELLQLDVEWEPKELFFTASYSNVLPNYIVEYASKRALEMASGYRLKMRKYE